MPTPRTSYIIGVTISGTDTAALQKVRVFNRNTNEYMPENDGNKKLALSTTKKVIFDCKDFASGFTNGDIIEIRINGAAYGSTTSTIVTTGGGKSTDTISATQESTALAAMGV